MNQLKAHAEFREEVVALVTKHLKKEMTAGKSSIKARGVEGKLEDGIRVIQMSLVSPSTHQCQAMWKMRRIIIIRMKG